MATKKQRDSQALPESVTLVNMYGYYDDSGIAKMWQENQVVTDPAEIADLIARQVPLKE